MDSAVTDYLNEPQSFTEIEKPRLDDMAQKINQHKDHPRYRELRVMLTNSRFLFVHTRDLLRVISQFDGVDLAVRNSTVLPQEVMLCATMRNNFNSSFRNLIYFYNEQFRELQNVINELPTSSQN